MKLTATHVGLLSRATQRDDGTLDIPAALKDRKKVVDQLLAAKLIEEVAAQGSQPVWRRNDQERPLALIITDAGLKALRPSGANRKSATKFNAAHKKAASAARTSAKRRNATASKTVSVKAPRGGRAAEKKRLVSKQDRVIALLRQPMGTTIAAIMKATGWQQHSVRGFFAGTVRRKLRLDLVSDGSGDKRVDRVVEKARSRKKKAVARVA
jgi:hypothetical protein